MSLGDRGQPTPCRKSPPADPPRAQSENGYVRCPRCQEVWTGLSYGEACPECGAVRLRTGNWFPWGDSE